MIIEKLLALAFKNKAFKDTALFSIAMASMLLFSSFLTAQATEQINGWVLDGKTKETVPGVHVINKRTLKGTISDADGYFELGLEKGDSILFSNIAYKYFYFVYRDSTVLEEVIITMEEQNYLLDEVSVFSYELTTNKPREMKLNKPRIKSNEEIDDPRPIKATLQNPAEYLYNLFGSKPRQLRKLAQLKAEDAYRRKLEESNNRRAVIALTGLNKDELEAFMFYCKYIPVNMNRLNDYEFLLAVQACFQRYMKDRELEGFLEQFD